MTDYTPPSVGKIIFIAIASTCFILLMCIVLGYLCYPVFYNDDKIISSAEPLSPTTDDGIGAKAEDALVKLMTKQDNVLMDALNDVARAVIIVDSIGAERIEVQNANMETIHKEIMTLHIRLKALENATVSKSKDGYIDYIEGTCEMRREYNDGTIIYWDACKGYGRGLSK